MKSDVPLSGHPGQALLAPDAGCGLAFEQYMPERLRHRATCTGSTQ